MGKIYSNISTINSNQIYITTNKPRFNSLEVYNYSTNPVEYIFPTGYRIIDLLNPAEPIVGLNSAFFFYDGAIFGPYLDVYSDGTNWINTDTSNIEDNTIITTGLSIVAYYRNDLFTYNFPINYPSGVEKTNYFFGKLNQDFFKDYTIISGQYTRSNSAKIFEKINGTYWSGIGLNKGKITYDDNRWNYYTGSIDRVSFTNQFSSGYGIPKYFWHNSNPLNSIYLEMNNIAPEELITKFYSSSPIGTNFNLLVNDDSTFDSYLTSLGYNPAIFRTDFIDEFGVTIDFSKHFLHIQAKTSSTIPYLVNELSGNYLILRSDIGIVQPAVGKYFLINVFAKEPNIFNTINLYFQYAQTPFQQLFL